MARMIKCVKLGQELEGLDFNPFPNTELGQRIYENVSKQAWQMWIQRSIMVINEFRLNLATKEGQRVYDQYMEEFLFGSGGKPPSGYRPPTS